MTADNYAKLAHKRMLFDGWLCCVLCKGVFGVPLDVCAQSMYHAIWAVADKVSNLSLREIHLVNIDPERTQFIQSVFHQLTSSDGQGLPLSENLPQKLPTVTEPEVKSPDGDRSQTNAGVKEEFDEEVREFLPEKTVRDNQTPEKSSGIKDMEKDEMAQTNAGVKEEFDEEVREFLPEKTVRDNQTPEKSSGIKDMEKDEMAGFDECHSKSPSDGRNIPDVEIVENRRHLLEGAEDLQDEKIRDEEQREGQESADEQSHHNSSDVPETVESFSDSRIPEQNGHVNNELPLDQVDKKSHELPATDEALSTPDINSQTLEVKVSDREQKSLTNSQPFMDQEDQKSADDIPDTEVSNTTQKDNQTLEKSSGIKDSETDEMAGYDGCHSLSYELEPQLGMYMQELNLEEYHESTPPTFSCELTPRLPLDLPEDVSQRPEHSGPRSVESYGQGNSSGDQELFHSLPVDAANQTGQ